MRKKITVLLILLLVLSAGLNAQMVIKGHVAKYDSQESIKLAGVASDQYMPLADEVIEIYITELGVGPVTMPVPQIATDNNGNYQVEINPPSYTGLYIIHIWHWYQGNLIE